MLAAFLVTLRACVEAGLVVGIVLAASHGWPGRGRRIALGVAGGLLAAGLAALLARPIGNAAHGRGQEILDGLALLAAAALLVRHAARTASGGGGRATGLAVVVGATILREGGDLALFLREVAGLGLSGFPLQVGALGGLAAGAALAAASAFGLVALAGRHRTAVTILLTVLLAAGMAAGGAHLLAESGPVTALRHPLWDSSALLSDDGLPGRVLHALVGYAARPTGLQALAFGATVLLTLGLMRGASRARREAA